MKIYTDASFDQKRKVAGWGIVVQDGMKERTYSNWFPVENINLAEMFAIHTACVLSGGRQCTIYTDSMTALSYIKGERGREYEKKKRAIWTREQYLNHKKMRVLAYQIKRLNPNISFEWIKAHRNVFQRESIANNMADLLAKRGIADYIRK